MKVTSSLLALVAVSAISFLPVALHAQDQGAPPPPMDQGAPPPPDQQGAPPPPDGQGAPPPPDQQGGGDAGASFDDFYNNLSNDGQWVQTPDYGYAFQPAVQDPNWAPYTDGHWVYTDAGWTWASNEPWGWATYHYGRWVNVVGTGWLWVPGYQWAPAWVSWRYGGGYCGWAPLPPSSFVGVEFGGPGVNLDFGFHFGGDCDTAYGIGPGCYNFIPIGFIGDPFYRGHYLDRGRNFVVINNTRNVTNITVNRGNRGAFGAVTAGGPDFARVNGQSHTPIQRARLAESREAGRSTLSNGTLNVFAPRINPATRQQARPTAVANSLSNVQINRGTSASDPLQVNSRFHPNAPSAATISAARTAQTHAADGIATPTRVPATASASAVQSERLQTAVRQQTEAQEQARNPSNHTAGGSANHPGNVTPGGGNQQTERNSQLEHQQAVNIQQSQAQHQAGASQQQHDEALRQQQNQEQQRQATATQQQHEQTLHQQQTQEQERQAAASQQQSQVQAEARERAAATTQQQHAPSEQHTTTQEHSTPSFTPQHTPTPQPQEHAPVPQQHSAPGGGGGSQQHSTGSGGGNHSSSGTGCGNTGANHGNGQNNNGQPPGH